MRVQSHPDDPIQGTVRSAWHVLYKGCNAVLDRSNIILKEIKWDAALPFGS